MTLLSHKSEVFVSSAVINTITNGVGQKQSGTERRRQPWFVYAYCVISGTAVTCLLSFTLTTTF